MPPPPPGRKKRSLVRNPVGRKVAGNAEGRASEFYSGPKPKTNLKGSFGVPKDYDALKKLFDILVPGKPVKVKTNTMRQFEAARKSLKTPTKRGR